jgi:RNA polymerase sigma-70 factor, ECF subfamily
MPDSSETAALIAAAQRGDQRALNDLLREHQPRMWAVCRRIIGSDSDAQDALQEALIAVSRHITRFDGKSAFSTWVYRIATNASLDELRRRGRRPVTLEEFPTGTTAIGAPVGLGSGDHYDTVIAERLRVDAALALLPPEFRAAVTLRDLCDLDYADIAEVLGIPAGTVRSRIARARAALATTLGTTLGTEVETLAAGASSHGVATGTNAGSANVQAGEGTLS